jgi:hypothetical protein
VGSASENPVLTRESAPWRPTLDRLAPGVKPGLDLRSQTGPRRFTAQVAGSAEKNRLVRVRRVSEGRRLPSLYALRSEDSRRAFSPRGCARTTPPSQNSPTFVCLRCPPPYKIRAMSVIGCHEPRKTGMCPLRPTPARPLGPLAASEYILLLIHGHSKCRGTERTLPKSGKTPDSPPLAPKGTRPRGISNTAHDWSAHWLGRQGL